MLPGILPYIVSYRNKTIPGPAIIATPKNISDIDLPNNANIEKVRDTRKTKLLSSFFQMKNYKLHW